MFRYPQLRRGNIDRYHKIFSLGEKFHANKWQNELAILLFQKCMLTALDRVLAVYCAQCTLDTHYTVRKKNPVPR